MELEISQSVFRIQCEPKRKRSWGISDAASIVNSGGLLITSLFSKIVVEVELYCLMGKLSSMYGVICMMRLCP